MAHTYNRHYENSYDWDWDFDNRVPCHRWRSDWGWQHTRPAYNTWFGPRWGSPVRAGSCTQAPKKYLPVGQRYYADYAYITRNSW